MSVQARKTQAIVVSLASRQFLVIAKLLVQVQNNQHRVSKPTYGLKQRTCFETYDQFSALVDQHMLQYGNVEPHSEHMTRVHDRNVS